jgi:hypothetical protein
MHDFAIVTASDSGYYSLLKGLLASLKKIGRAPLYVLDLGLTEEQATELRDLGAHTVVPGWDVQISQRMVRSRHGNKISLRGQFRAFTAQPFLPKYVPDHDILLWIDADCWVQDASTIDLYLRAASEGLLAISLEVDRCYSAPYWRLKYEIPDQIRAFGISDGFFLAKKMPANVGVLALKANAPHWQLWQSRTKMAMHRPQRRSQQMAMNYVVYIDKAPAAFLPAYCNWQSWETIPLLDEATGLLVEPHPPYNPIGIMHNAHEDKNLVFEVKTRQGNSRLGTMRYEQWYR